MDFKIKSKTQDYITGYLFILPALIILIVAVIGPMLYTFYYSFLDYNMLQPNNKFFIGIENYINVLKDEIAIKSVKNTFFFVIFVVPLQTSLGFIFALIVNKSTREMSFFKIAFFSPSIMSLAVISGLWLTILNPQSGILNSMLAFVNIPAQPFLTSVKQALPSIVGISAWHGCGVQMLIFLAALKNIPLNQYEAAKVDGANALQTYFLIILPNCKAVFATIAVFSFIAVWNDFLWAVMIFSDASKQTVQVGLQGFMAIKPVYTGQVMAALTLITIPIIIINIIFQKYIVQGMAHTSIKG